jgi:ribonuclease P protein component
MLPGANRLRRRQDFAVTMRRGRRAGRRHLVVHVYSERGRPSDPSETSEGAVATASPRLGELPLAPRAGFVVPKAVGTAVVRNKVKRRLRHLVRERLQWLPAGSLVVVRALPPSGGASSAQLAADLDAVLRRLLADMPRSDPPSGGRS